ETVARPDGAGGWTLHGLKWFTSAATSQMALTLARPEGNPPGGKGLALFYVETRDGEGRLRGIRVRRLKEKLGTRKLPTAELELDGAPARLVGEPHGGVRAIAPMLNLTRAWNAVSAVALMRRGLALARDYAARRTAFGAPLSEQPLHADTLGGLQAEFEGAVHLTFRVAELLGSEEDGGLLRLLTPLAKLTTARQAVAVTSECLEAFGGAGYVEDTGIPRLLRDAQVLPIWEGTTNVLALDVVRAVVRDKAGLPLLDRLEQAASDSGDTTLARTVADLSGSLSAVTADPTAADVVAGARTLALRLGYALAAALLVTWDDPVAQIAARLWIARRLAGRDIAVEAHPHVEALCG
ncbi:MAG TPA: acyl-CoA dehydrogenase family protein, partial [Gemmatimonadales bacterium]